MQKAGQNLSHKAPSESAGKLGPRVVVGISERLKAVLVCVDCRVAALLTMTVFAPPQVTTYLHKDYNNLWIIKKHDTNAGNVLGTSASRSSTYSEPVTTERY